MIRVRYKVSKTREGISDEHETNYRRGPCNNCRRGVAAKVVKSLVLINFIFGGICSVDRNTNVIFLE